MTRDVTPPRSKRSPFRAWIDGMIWLGRHEFATLAMLFLVAGGVWLFLQIGSEVAEGESRSIDEHILLALRNAADPSDPLGPAWFEEVMRDYTALGGIGVQAVIVAIVA